MVRPIKHVWFDYSDTLARINRKELNKLQYSVYAADNKRPITPELIEDFKKQREEHKGSASLFAALGLTDVVLDRMRIEADKLYELADSDIPDVLNTLRKVIPISIFSNNEPELSALGIDPTWFTHILGPDRIKNPKPALEGFYKMVELSNLPIQEIIFIGDDVDKDLVPAKQVGILTGLLWKRAKEADYCFDNFKAIQEFFT